MAGKIHETKIRVLKLGGSLLDWPAFPKRLAELIHEHGSSGAHLIVVGGGAVVDAVRFYDDIHSLDPVAVHWLSVELMNSTTKLAQMIFSSGQLLDSAESLSRWLDEVLSRGEDYAITHGTPVAFVCPSAFYSWELNADALPTNWDTSSDSISALLARLIDADELWLIKSVDAVSNTDGLVDPAFKRALPEGVTLRIVNLRSRG
jgi:aspartokinase-like uncharacterized kinase